MESDDAGRAAGRRPAERAIHRRAGADADRPPRGVQGHRARRRGEPAEDGEAVRPRRRLPGRRRTRAGRLAGARRHAARGARVQHHRRQGRRGIEVAGDGRRSAPGTGLVEPARARPGRRRHASSRNGSTRPATVSSSSSAGRCRRRRASRRGDAPLGRDRKALGFRLWALGKIFEYVVEGFARAESQKPRAYFLYRTFPPTTVYTTCAVGISSSGIGQDVLREHDDVGVLPGLQRSL